MEKLTKYNKNLSKVTLEYSQDLRSYEHTYIYIYLHVYMYEYEYLLYMYVDWCRSGTRRQWNVRNGELKWCNLDKQIRSKVTSVKLIFGIYPDKPEKINIWIQDKLVRKLIYVKIMNEGPNENF